MLLFLLGGAAPADEAAPARYDVVIERDAFRFDPPSIVIETGDTVRWLNRDERRHLTASVPGSGPTDRLEIFCPELNPGKECAHTFTVAGRYPYFCFIHRKMVGEVVVLDR